MSIFDILNGYSKMRFSWNRCLTTFVSNLFLFFFELTWGLLYHCAPRTHSAIFLCGLFDPEFKSPESQTFGLVGSSQSLLFYFQTSILFFGDGCHFAGFFKRRSKTAGLLNESTVKDSPFLYFDCFLVMGFVLNMCYFDFMTC